MQPNLPQDAKFSPQNRERHHAALSGRQPAREGTRRRGARLHASDLAGIGLPVPAPRATPSRWRRSPTSCPRGRCSSPAPPAWTSRCRAKPSAVLQCDPGDRRSTARSSVDIRQGPSGALRRIPAAAARGPDPGPRLAAIRAHAGRVRAGGERSRACRARPAADRRRRSATRRSSPARLLPDGPRPSLILNVTNDAWFGFTPGPYQHFAQARLARRRGRPAPCPRRQYRHHRRRRSVRPNRRRAAPRHARACSMPLSQ